MMLQAWHTCFWVVSSILLCRPSRVSVHSQPFSNLSRDVQQGSTYRVVPKPLLRYLGCVVWVIVLLQDKPSVWGLEHSGADYHQGSIDLSLDTDESSRSCRCIASPQHDAATTMLHCRDGIKQVPFLDITFRIHPKKKFNLFNQARDCSFSTLAWSPSGGL